MNARDGGPGHQLTSARPGGSLTTENFGWLGHKPGLWGNIGGKEEETIGNMKHTKQSRPGVCLPMVSVSAHCVSLVDVTGVTQVALSLTARGVGT